MPVPQQTATPTRLEDLVHRRPLTVFFALAAPVLLYGAMNLVFMVLGVQVDPSLLGDRLPIYASTWLAALWAGCTTAPTASSCARCCTPASPAQEHLMLLTGHQITVGVVQLAALIAAATAVVVATHGRLGTPEKAQP